MGRALGPEISALLSAPAAEWDTIERLFAALGGKFDLQGHEQRNSRAAMQEREEIAALRIENVAPLRSSTSWRITAPVRIAAKITSALHRTMARHSE